MGNCASTTEQLTLPVRAASDSEVSLTKIVNPRRRVVVKRVLVGWHWVTIRRGPNRPGQAGGHHKTVKVLDGTVPTRPNVPATNDLT